MNDKWYYSQSEARLGPVSFEELRQLIASDQLCAEDMVWQKGMDEWIPAVQVEGMFLPPPIPPRFASTSLPSPETHRIPVPLSIPAPRPPASASPNRKQHAPSAQKPSMGLFKKVAITIIIAGICIGLLLPAAHKAVERQPEPTKPEVAAKEQPASAEPQPATEQGHVVSTTMSVNRATSETSVSPEKIIEEDFAATENARFHGTLVPFIHNADTKRIACWIAGAKAGIPKAEMLYAYVLSYDSRYAKPFQEIIKWLHAAAEKNISAAQKELGFVYANGLGVSRNYAGAVKWYRKAADQGDAEAQCAMGSCYEEGLGVSQDYAEAVKWYHKAVELGSPIAQTCLGGCYKDGHGVPQSYPEALNWYRKAAEQGYAQGQFDVGACYYNGQGVSKDRAEAIKWFRKAAEQDYALAQKTLSQLGESWQSPVDKRFGPPLSANSIKKPPGFEKPIEVQIPVNLITGTPFLNPFIVATRTKSATVSRNGSVDVLFCSKIAPLLNGANQGAVAMPERIPVATMLFLVYAKLGQIAGVWALQNGKQELLMSSNARWEGMLFCGNQVCSVRFSHDPPLSAPYFIKLPEGSFIWDKIDEFMQFPEPRWSAIIRFAGGGDSNDSSH